MPAPTPFVLVVTDDPLVHEHARVAAAASGAGCRRADDPGAAEASAAVLVLVDARLPGCWAGPAVVPDALLVAPDGAGPAPPGAVRLPSGRDLLGSRVATAVAASRGGRAGPGEGLVVGVVGAVGGAGTSVLALALAAAGGGRLVDADPVRTGTVASTGTEHLRASGRDGPGAGPIDADGVPVVVGPLPGGPEDPGGSWGASAPAPGALADALDAGRREVPLVVVDLPGLAGGTVWRRADAAVLVVPDAVPAALAARPAVRHLRRAVPRVLVVVRSRRRGGPGRTAVAEVVGDAGQVPVVGWGRHEALAAAADAGALVPCVRRGPTAVAARRVLGLLPGPGGGG